MTKSIITQEELKELLHYNPDTGVFIWIKVPKKSLKISVGLVAGYKNYYGYCSIYIKGALFPAHRLAFLYMNGLMPVNFIDHVNGNPFDNKFDNLREASHLENMRNKKMRKDNTSGYVGIEYVNKSNRWRAVCNTGGKKNFLGSFASKEEASEAYNDFAKLKYGEFYNPV